MRDFPIYVFALFLIGLVAWGSTRPPGWFEEQLKAPYGAVEPDSDSLCPEVLAQLKSMKAQGKSLLDLDEKALTQQGKLWEICKKREEFEEINRRYRESQSLLGRLGTVSGIVLTFFTAVAAMYIAYLGSRWTTSKSEAEQRQIEQKRKIDRNDYDFKLFDALSGPESPLSKMAASAALQARLDEIDREANALQRRWLWRFSPTMNDSFKNLDSERQTIIRVFLSALKEARAQRSSAVSQASTGHGAGTAEKDEVTIVANKTIAEGIAEALGCFLPVSATTAPPDKSTPSPLRGYDVQKLDLRSVYWGTKPPKLGYAGRGAFNGKGLDFWGSDFSNASLRGASLDKVIFYEVTLRSVTFREAQLAGANFDNAIVEECDFRGADISGCDFSRCAVFRNNKNDRTTITISTTWPADFTRLV